MPNKKENASKWSSFQLKKSLLKVFFFRKNWSAFGLFFKKIGLPDKVGTLRTEYRKHTTGLATSDTTMLSTRRGVFRDPAEQNWNM